MRGIPHTAGRSGNHHFPVLFATMALLLSWPGAPAQAQGDPALDDQPAAAAPAPVSFTQRGVPAEATAENGVIAREQALASGRRAAWNRIASSLGFTRTLSDSQIESMVTSMVIEEERITPTRYAGRITVNFNPSRVRAIAGTSGGGDVAGAGGGGSLDLRVGEGSQRMPPMPATSSIDAVARYGSFREWTELRRRLTAAGPIARVEIVGIATDRARLRIGLRTPAGLAAPDLARIGVTLTPPLAGGPAGTWQLGLAGGA